VRGWYNQRFYKDEVFRAGGWVYGMGGKTKGFIDEVFKVGGE